MIVIILSVASVRVSLSESGEKLKVVMCCVEMFSALGFDCFEKEEFGHIVLQIPYWSQFL